jgi:hypothetical protein
VHKKIRFSYFPAPPIPAARIESLPAAIKKMGTTSSRGGLGERPLQVPTPPASGRGGNCAHKKIRFSKKKKHWTLHLQVRILQQRWDFVIESYLHQTPHLHSTSYLQVRFNHGKPNPTPQSQVQRNEAKKNNPVHEIPDSRL